MDDWTIIVGFIACGVLFLCGVLQLIADIIQIVMKIKGKDRTEDKEDECKKDEGVA